jgi:hypothetical protein
MSILCVTIVFFINLILFSNILPLVAEDGRTESRPQRITDLRGIWKFSIGDEENWKSPDFDDSSWDDMFVPSSWEDEGYPGYVGYAWYRKKIILKSEHKNKYLYLNLGYIDDVDEVYVNGNFVGFAGSLPPNYFTAYHLERKYSVLNDYWNYDGENVIAVRVFNAELSGGLLRGLLGIYDLNYDIPFEIYLEGIWKFYPGDDPESKEQGFNDWDWTNVMVPAPWETQGFKDYDGFAWYRKSVYIPPKYRGTELVLLLGKIDDLDQTYLNGNLVGETGNIDGVSLLVDDEWLENRGYKLEESYIQYGSDNIIAVRVYDALVSGGIYQGPVGIVTEENFRKWQKKTGEKKGFFDYLWGD